MSKNRVQREVASCLNRAKQQADDLLLVAAQSGRIHLRQGIAKTHPRHNWNPVFLQQKPIRASNRQKNRAAFGNSSDRRRHGRVAPPSRVRQQ